MTYSKNGGKGYGNYDLEPTTVFTGFNDQVWQGYDNISAEIQHVCKKKTVVIAEFYPGVNGKEILKGLSALSLSTVFNAESCAKDIQEIDKMLADYLTEDRVFGRMNANPLDSLFDEEKLMAMRKAVRDCQDGIILVYGTGASLVIKGDVLLYFNLVRREIQLRYTNGLGNFLCDNAETPYLSKYKRGYFIEWRMADRLKCSLFDGIDYLVDTNLPGRPTMCTGRAYREGLKQLSIRPFRLLPYFAPEVWGGQWLKTVCGLDPLAANYAWGFDGVPEENSLLLLFGRVRVHIPAIDLVFLEPQNLLGDFVYQRFGAEFPIRFDLLDTIDGGNLSLQVHPMQKYIHNKFGLNYTQDESYYILDTNGDDSFVYLGLKQNIDQAAFEEDLRQAQLQKISFDAERYMNKVPVKKHDHVLIPAGTVHCSGKNNMVLEISATPYIFTFKMWDWGRTGMDGLPRPTHIDHALKNIQFDRDTAWVYKNLVHQTVTLSDKDNIKEEHTGLHELEFIESRRHTSEGSVEHQTHGSVNVLNLVEGAQAVVESPGGNFSPFVVHYAETFIIPAGVERYRISPHGPSVGKQITTIKAYVKK